MAISTTKHKKQKKTYITIYRKIIVYNCGSINKFPGRAKFE